MNKSTRFTIFILTTIFLTAQIVYGLCFINVIGAFTSVGNQPEVSEGIMLWGVKGGDYDFKLLNATQFEILILILALVVCVVSFFLFQFLRTLLQSVNDGEIFDQTNLTKIKRILVLYLSLGVVNFSIKTLCSVANVEYVYGLTGSIIGNLLHVILMAAGIYTIYFVFKYGVNLKKENEAIV